MSNNIHVLHPNSAPVSGFLRVGHSGHLKLHALIAEDRFPYKRVVFDAAHILKQKVLLKSLQERGCEIILDPNFAEMATEGRYSSSTISALGWANTERPWSPNDFERRGNFDVAKLIAEFAVSNNVNVVLAPTHVTEEINAPWQESDRTMCVSLREELDRLGGSHIAIDFQIMTNNSMIRDEQGRQSLMVGMGDLPIDNVWIRTSGFGANATGAGTRAHVEAVRHFHTLEKPIIADGVGGFAGLAIAAFGAVSGISHGVGQKENFSAKIWNRKSTGGGGSAIRTYIPSLDRYFKEDQLNAFFATRGAKSRFACNDKSCCKHGAEDMIENAHAHFLTQRRRQIDDLSAVPETRRAEHFLLRHLDPAVRDVRRGAKLKIANEEIQKAIVKSKSRLVRLRDALGSLNDADDSVSRSKAPTFRGNGKPINSVLSIRS